MGYTVCRRQPRVSGTYSCFIHKCSRIRVRICRVRGRALLLPCRREGVYIDLSFYGDLKERYGAPGDFAQAYVIAHEVGHHVQNLLGISEQVQSAQQGLGTVEANRLSVMQELQADCFAGVWAHNADEARDLLEQGDVEEGLNAASSIGDDRLQMESQGRVTPDSFTHGSSAQRVSWFQTGLESGDINSCNTFEALNQ